VNINTSEQVAEFTFLETGLEKVWDKPAERLRIAEEYFKLASQSEKLDPQTRIQAYQRAIKLDPFTGRYRLYFARYKHQMGLHNEAIKEFQSALDFWQDWHEMRLFYTEALLDDGQYALAQKEMDILLKAVPENCRVKYAQIELILRDEKLSDWQKAVDLLSQIQVQADDAGVFCEKCIKVLIDCNDEAIRSNVLKMADEKMSVEGIDSGAYNLLKTIGRHYDKASNLEAIRTRFSSELKDSLFNYISTQNNDLNGDETDAQLEKLRKWQERLKENKKNSGFNAAYLHVLDKWAAKAYEQEDLLIAKVLWEEGNRSFPANPAIIQNLALVNTRLGNEQAYHNYWQSLTQTWSAYCELMPESDGYITKMITKHQAFIEAARKKLNQIKDLNDLLELGTEWARELVSYSFLCQMQFNNVYFIGGLSRSDFVSDTQRKAAIQEGFKSMKTWEQLVSEWNGMFPDSKLSEWRVKRIDFAQGQVVTGGDSRFDQYDQEKETFDHHREYLIQHYIPLLLGVLLKISREGDLSNSEFRTKYVDFAKIMVSFPHNLFKPAVEKVVEDIKEVPDMRELVINHAIGYWLGNAQKKLEEKEPIQGIPLLKTALEIVPDSVTARFLLARCYADTQSFTEAYEILEEAKPLCQQNDDLSETIETFTENVKIAAINQELSAVTDFIKKEQGRRAVAACMKVISKFGEHPYSNFVLAQAYLVNLQINLAKKALQRAKKLEIGEKELAEAIDTLLEQLTKNHGAQIIINRASQKMAEEKWQEALDCIDIGKQDVESHYWKEAPKADIKQAVNKKSMWEAAMDMLDESRQDKEKSIIKWPAELYFYTAICYFRLDDWKKAKREAEHAKRYCDDNKDLLIQINNLMEQIDLGPIAKEMEAINKALKSENWYRVDQLADEILKKRPETPVVLFYKALSLFRQGQDGSLGSFSKAEDVIHRFNRLSCHKPYDIKNQMQELAEAIPKVRRVAGINSIVNFLNNEEFYLAANAARGLNTIDECAEGYYFQALAEFRMAIVYIKSGSSKADVFTFEEIKRTLDKAERLVWRSSDPSLKEAIRNLEQNIDNVISQIRWL
jgi:thioredoxin-like negative regulator of GroEL/predicted transcriptional regulator